MKSEGFSKSEDFYRDVQDVMEIFAFLKSEGFSIKIYMKSEGLKSEDF